MITRRSFFEFASGLAALLVSPFRVARTGGDTVAWIDPPYTTVANDDRLVIQHRESQSGVMAEVWGKSDAILVATFAAERSVNPYGVNFGLITYVARADATDVVLSFAGSAQRAILSDTRRHKYVREVLQPAHEVSLRDLVELYQLG